MTLQSVPSHMGVYNTTVIYSSLSRQRVVPASPCVRCPFSESPPGSHTSSVSPDFHYQHILPLKNRLRPISSDIYSFSHGQSCPLFSWSPHNLLWFAPALRSEESTAISGLNCTTPDFLARSFDVPLLSHEPHCSATCSTSYMSPMMHVILHVSSAICTFPIMSISLPLVRGFYLHDEPLLRSRHSYSTGASVHSNELLCSATILLPASVVVLIQRIRAW